MAQIPGSVPLTGKVAPTDTTDTFATHVDIYGEGGYMTVANTTERDAITTERRKQGMAVFVNDTNEMYILQDGVTNANWVLFSGGSGASDLQSVLEGGSQFLKPNGYTGGILTINYSGVTSNPSDPASNTTGVLIDANSTGTNTGENLMIAASGSADAAFVTLHAQNTNSLPIGPVPYSRLEVGQSNIVIDTNSASWQGTSVGDMLFVRSVNPGVGTGSKYEIATTNAGLNPNMQDVFNNSTPNIIATDVTKDLSLLTAEATISTTDSDGGTSEIILQASNSSMGTKNELKIDGTANTTILTTNNLDVEVRASNTTSGPEVGDVLMIDSLQNSTYGRLKYKTGVQLYRQTITSSEVRNLFTTPVQLLSGIPSRYLMILQAYVSLDTQTPNVPYNAGVKLEIQNDAFSVPILQTNEFLQSTFQGARTFYPMDPSTILPDECPAASSAGWKLTCTADPGNLGTGVLRMWITYMVLP